MLFVFTLDASSSTVTQLLTILSPYAFMAIVANVSIKMADVEKLGACYLKLSLSRNSDCDNEIPVDCAFSFN